MDKKINFIRLVEEKSFKTNLILKQKENSINFELCLKFQF
jgi:hypothetical protein